MLNKIFKKKTENVETATNRQDLQQKEAPVAMVSSKKKGVFGKILDLRKKKDPKSSEAGPERDFVEGLVSTKDIIAPSAIEVDFNHIRINNKYFCTTRK